MPGHGGSGTHDALYGNRAQKCIPDLEFGVIPHPTGRAAALRTTQSRQFKGPVTNQARSFSHGIPDRPRLVTLVSIASRFTADRSLTTVCSTTRIGEFIPEFVWNLHDSL